MESLAYLIGDSCFGICDTVDDEVGKLDADLALHIGHNAVVQTVGEFTHLIDAKDDVKFESVIRTFHSLAQGIQAHRPGHVQPTPRRT